MEGKVALITGGASGIGKAIARALLDKGAKVCILDVNEESGSKTENEFADEYPNKSYFKKCDVASSQELEECFQETIKRYGGLDIVCNNAGISDETKWRDMVTTNLSSIIDGTFLGLKYMKREPGNNSGVIINTSSVAGLVPIKAIPVYCAVKSGIIGLTRSLGSTSPKFHGIRINCFCPAAVDTPFGSVTTNPVFEGVPEIHDAVRQAMRRPGARLSPQEVADCVISLIEDESLSGEIMFISREQKGILKLPESFEDLVTKT